jgi:hypothetical protein
MIHKLINLLFHGFALACGIYYSNWVFTNMHPQFWSGHGAFLTQWSHILQNFLLLLLLVDDLRALSGSKGSSTFVEEKKMRKSEAAFGIFCSFLTLQCSGASLSMDSSPLCSL